MTNIQSFDEFVNENKRVPIIQKYQPYAKSFRSHSPLEEDQVDSRKKKIRFNLNKRSKNRRKFY